MKSRAADAGPAARPARCRIALICALLLLAGCARGGGHSDEEAAAMPQQPIEEVLARRAPELMRIDGVLGLGQGLCDEQPCIRVYLRDQAAAARVPARLDGYRIDPLVTGVIRPGGGG